jgi:sodium-dependent dicarboxylate transporter 2/3/5
LTNDHNKKSQLGSIAVFGMLAGPLLAVLVYVTLPESYINSTGAKIALPEAARMVAAIATLMAVWWMTEAISIYATALIPLALFPLTGVADIKLTAASYGNPIVYLFLGGFIVALALERWGLHRRLALNVLARVGANPRSIVGAFMAVSAVLSMWVTNTATTIMLLPVAVSVITLLPDNDLADGSADSPFAICMLLGIAYAASIGGMGTIIGTAPNVFVVAFLNEHLDREIGFLEWMRFAVPLVIVFVPLAWFVLTRLVYPIRSEDIEGAAQLLESERARLPSLSRGELLPCWFFC